MLHEREARAVHDGIVLLVLEDHAENRRPGQRLVDAVAHAGKPLAAQEVFIEAGTVMRECAHDAVLLGVRAHDRGVHRKVAPFGMTSHVERAVERRSSLLQVLLSRHLRGHGALEGHVEIFLPAHEGRVRSAKGDIGGAIWEQKRRCSELLFGRVVKRRAIPGDAHPTEARVGANGEEQVAPAVWIPAIAEHLLEILRPQKLPNRSPLPRCNARHLMQQPLRQAIVGEP